MSPVRNLYASIPGINQILSVSISHSHNASTATAIVKCVDHNKSLGDSLIIDLGYTGNHGRVFKGYVKKIEQKVPDNTWIITAQDMMIRAIDYFVAASDPAKPYSWSNISAEDLIGNVLNLAGITNYQPDPTYFILAIQSKAEVNLVSAFDYCKMIADIIAYGFWADQDGIIKLKNRKPFVMCADGPESLQPGFEADTSYDPAAPDYIGLELATSSNLIDTLLNKNERDLRNRVVAYGADNLSGEAKKSTSWNPLTKTWESALPGGFYKTMAAASPIMDTQDVVDKAARYNLALYNRIGYQFSATVEGDYRLVARKTINVTNPYLMEGKQPFYIYLAEHEWSRNGYLVSMELRK